MSEQTIQLANGVVIDPVTRKPISRSKEAVQAHREKKLELKRQELKPAALINNSSFRKKLSDLPADPKQMNPTLLVVGYFLLGLDNRDIAEATGFTTEQVQLIRELDLFDEVRSAVVANLKLNNKEHIAAELENAGLMAAQKIVDLANGAEDEKVQLAASKDILDRVGFRPADVHEHRISGENELRVRIIKDDKELKTIDLPAMEVDNE